MESTWCSYIEKCKYAQFLSGPQFRFIVNTPMKVLKLFIPHDGFKTWQSSGLWKSLKAVEGREFIQNLDNSQYDAYSDSIVDINFFAKF